MAEPIRLYLDEDTISRALIRALLARNVDLLTAQEANLIAATDTTQMAFAASQNRTIFTFNTKDFAQLHTHHLAIGQQHAGIIVSDQLQVGLLVRRLMKLLDARSAEDMRNWLEFLSNWR